MIEGVQAASTLFIVQGFFLKLFPPLTLFLYIPQISSSAGKYRSCFERVTVISSIPTDFGPAR